jgi:threonine synthase
VTYRGCATCAAEGVAVNLACDISWDADHARAVIRSPKGGTGLWKYAPLLPVPDQFAVTIGEGDTPLLRLDNLGRDWGMGRLHVKVEGQNPTWSHKDRLCAVGVAAARWSGSSVVTASSTGNHGASVAAYAARAGLGCVIFTLASVPGTMKTLMQAYGAEVVACRTLEERYTIMLECAQRFGWFPLTNSVHPPIGSSPYGVEGYKTIAYELWTQLGGAVPDWIVVPVAYGDCLAGIHRGWEDLLLLGLVDRVPRLVGAEIFGPLAQALTSSDAPFGPVPASASAA